MTTQPSHIDLTVALNDTDHVRDLRTGAVSVEGATLRTLHMPVEEIFYRFTSFREWDVSEMSLGKFCTMRAAGDDTLVGLPVFLSRTFRHSGIFIRSDGPVDEPEKLAGSRIGFPEWTVTATIYQRALLQHEYGVDIKQIEWVQGGVNEPGRIETLGNIQPESYSIRQEPERSLNDLLLEGEIDAIIAPRPPKSFSDSSGRVVQLFSDPQQVEHDYFTRTQIFPIMHLLVMNRTLYEAHPWLGPNLVNAFTIAKDRSLERLGDLTASYLPVPWGTQDVLQKRVDFGNDLWPYGVERNMPTLTAFLSYLQEQELTSTLLQIEDIFPSSVLTQHSV